MIAIVNGTVLTITNGTIPNGTVLIENGKIQAVGNKDMAIPEGARVIDATNKFVTPGLIDAHSHLSVWGEPFLPANSDFNEMTGPVQAAVRGIDALNPEDQGIKFVREAGVTTVYTGPGSGNIIGGTGMAIKTRGRTVFDMVIPGTEAMKMALGENPKRNYGNRKQKPSTRMGNAAVLRQALIAAQNYMRKIERAEAEAKDGETPKYPDRDLSLEMLSKVLKREMKARIHSHRADDIVTAIRIAEEFNLDFTIEHATEGYLVADILAEKNVPCVVGPIMMPPTKHELWHVRQDNAAKLVKAGVKIAIMVDKGSETMWLPTETGIAVRFGLPEEEALKAITINAAEIIGIEDRVGSLEVGKDADVAVFDGPPLLNYTSCDVVIIDGEVLFERNATCCC